MWILFLLSCFVLDSRLRTRQPEGARPRARGGAEAQRQGVPGRAHPGAAPREVGLVDYVSYLICSVSDTIESRLVPADPFPIRLVGSLLTGTRKRWRRMRLRRCSRRRPAPPTLHGQQEQGRRQEVGGTGTANACGATSVRLSMPLACTFAST